jgi:hypothetical protein
MVFHLLVASPRQTLGTRIKLCAGFQTDPFRFVAGKTAATFSLRESRVLPVTNQERRWIPIAFPNR